MSKLSISLSISCLSLLFLLIICTSATKIDSLSNYQYDNNDGELKNLLIPDNFFSLKNINGRSDQLTIGSDNDYQYEQFRIIPYKKRTIPIELQKALYAHGIVGRRR